MIIGLQNVCTSQSALRRVAISERIVKIGLNLRSYCNKLIGFPFTGT